MTAALLLFLRSNWLTLTIVGVLIAGSGVLYLKGRHDGAASAEAAAKTAVVNQLTERNATDAKVEGMSPAELCRAIGGVWRNDGCE